MWKKTGGERGRPRGDWRRMEQRSAALEAADAPRIYRRRESDLDVPVNLSPPAVGSSGVEWRWGLKVRSEDLLVQLRSIRCCVETGSRWNWFPVPRHRAAS